MLQKSLLVAMAADISLSRYDQPSVVVRAARKWLIVSRLGAEGEFITISVSEEISTPEHVAPIGIHPMQTLVGLLLSEDAAAEATFLLVRQNPVGLGIAGTFFPADGYARVVAHRDGLRLVSEGRHAHNRGRENTREIRKDIPDPAPNAAGAMAWHVRGVRRPWIGEVDPGARRAAPHLETLAS
jgi:hypothetical protein